MRKLIGLAMALCLVAVMIAPLGGTAQEKKDFKNFVIILDHSNEMNATHNKKSKNYIARKVAERILNNIDKLKRPFKGSIYMYGIMAAENENRVLKLQGFSDFELFKYQLALDKAEPQAGPSTLSVALRDLRRDMQEDNVQGATAVFILSGGNLTDVDDEVDRAKELKLAFPDTCIYTITVGDSKRGEKNLKEVTDKGKCGYNVNADSLHSGAQVEDYINAIFNQ